MWPEPKSQGLWPWLSLLLLLSQGPWLPGPRVTAAPSALRVHYDCGEQGLQLLASLLPWPPGDRLTFKILDEFGNAKEVEDCWACQHWVTEGPQGEAVLVIKYSGCYIYQKGNNFQIKVRVLQQSNSTDLSLVEDVTMMCPNPVTEDHYQELPMAWGATTGATPQGQASPSLGNVTILPSVCQVGSGRIQCAATFASVKDCLKAGCCYDASDQTTSCYYGNKVTMLCTPEGFFLVVVSHDVLGQLILLDTLHFADTGPACQPQVVTSSFRLFRFPLSQCGTTVQLTSDRVVYENELTSVIDVQHTRDGSITRDVVFTLRIRCSYTTSDTLPVVAEVFTLPPPQPIAEAGPLRLEMRIAKDALYGLYYSEAEYPVVKVLRDPIFLEVRLLQRTDPGLTLVLNDCWAGQTTNPVQEPQWPILLNGCPFAGDNYQSHLTAPDGTLQFPSHYSRFTVATFTFVGAASPLSYRGLVYFFCSASVCHPSPEQRCTPLCLPPRARRKRFFGLLGAEDQPVSLAVSHGPVILQESHVVERKQELLEPPSTTAPVLITWLPLAAGVATGMGVTLLAVAVLCWRRLGEAVFALAMQG